MKEVEIYTDGACKGNPGPGGYGAVLKYRHFRKEISGGFACTTNNRMEILGAIAALEALLEPCSIVLRSDSSYLVNAVSKGWLKKWQKSQWLKADREPVVNVDLWQRLLELTARHRVRFEWVKGHADNPENNRCDQLATAAAAAPDLPPDHGFTKTARP